MAVSGRLKLAGLDPEVRRNADWCLSVAEYYGVPVEVTSGFRSWQDQERLRRNYEQCLTTGSFGKTPDCQYPANKPGESSHNYGLSWDSVVPSWAQSWWNAVRELAGFRVPPGDLVHAEVPDWQRFT